MFYDYSRIVSEAKYKTNYKEGFKILTPKQRLQRLTTALAHVKASNASENQLNEIRHNIYSLHQAKEIAKKSIQQYNESKKVTKQNWYYIYEF